MKAGMKEMMWERKRCDSRNPPLSGFWWPGGMKKTKGAKNKVEMRIALAKGKR